ncbi:MULTISPECIES: ROK family protein [Solibacillus]|uniref:ROK family protein n=1 Tax=Solibacillus merdavium TaxID=2762218 RepID=A0ABR8XQZ6_9BACL|nr:ROK family protein [Solibacillus merdavium]MBD8034350.1 ROK family protein [Solibacillus merdavium]
MSWNQQIGKKFNKQQILNYIFSKRIVSRGEIIEEIGLKKATVANLVTELIEDQLIVEDGKDFSTGGRRSQLLRFNETAGFALGIDIGVNYLYGAVFNLKGEIVFDNLQLVPTIQLDAYLKSILNLIELLMENVPPSPFSIVGLGVAVPGSVNKDGVIIIAPNLRWEDFDIRGYLRNRFDFPIYISNEANAGAYAEYIFENNKETSNLLYLSIGIGLGVGIIIDHNIYLGVNGYSGESGHAIIHMNGRKCTCGRNGCWEAYASEYALIHDATYMLKERELSLEQLITLAEEGHEDVIQLFKETGYYIGLGITNLIQTFNPEKIIIGNRIIKAQKFIEQSILDTINSNTMHFQRDNYSVQFSTLKDRAIALGAASFIIDQFIQLPFD